LQFNSCFAGLLAVFVGFLSNNPFGLMLTFRFFAFGREM
jgi:hypothetical protein